MDNFKYPAHPHHTTDEYISGYKNILNLIKIKYEQNGLIFPAESIYILYRRLGEDFKNEIINYESFNPALHNEEYYNKLSNVLASLKTDSDFDSWSDSYTLELNLFPIVKQGEKYVPLKAKTFSNDETVSISHIENETLIIALWKNSEYFNNCKMISNLHKKINSRKHNYRFVTVGTGSKSELENELTKYGLNNLSNYYLEENSKNYIFFRSIYNAQDSLRPHFIIVNTNREVIVSRHNFCPTVDEDGIECPGHELYNLNDLLDIAEHNSNKYIFDERFECFSKFYIEIFTKNVPELNVDKEKAGYFLYKFGPDMNHIVVHSIKNFS